MTGAHLQLLINWRFINPVDGTKADFFVPQPAVLQICRYIDHVLGHVFTNYVIGQSTANIEALALSESVKQSAIMPANHLCFLVDDNTRLFLYVLLQELFNSHFADKTDTHALLFV